MKKVTIDAFVKPLESGHVQMDRRRDCDSCLLQYACSEYTNPICAADFNKDLYLDRPFLKQDYNGTR